MASHADDAPIVAVAVDLSETGSLAEELRITVGRIMGSLPGARLACLNVIQLGLITLDNTLDDKGDSKHVQRLVELRHWAEPLKLDEGRVSVHVLESPRLAEAILGYARANQVDHLIMGAKADSAKGSASGVVSAQAPCTVTVVRPSRFGKAECGSGADDGFEVSEAESLPQ